MTEHKIPIPGRIYNASGGNVCGADDVIDDVKGKKQSQINTEVDSKVSTLEQNVGPGGSVDERINNAKTSIIGDAGSDYNTLGKLEDKIQEETATRLDEHYLKTETYNKNELNNLITTPNQEYVTVVATDQTTAATDVLPATGSADTIYRVGNWDGSQYDESLYTEYAWNGSAYVPLSVKSQIGEIYDISFNHAGATYADLAAALSTNGANIPVSLRKGGMSIKYVQSSDNKYVQYRLMAQTFSTEESDWQGVDDEPIAGSDNLVKSSGIDGRLMDLLSGHYPVTATGQGSTTISKSFSTIVGHTYRIYYPSNWTVDDAAITASNTVFLIKSDTSTIVNSSVIFKSGFSNKGLYVDYTATTTTTRFEIRGDSGLSLEFEIIDMNTDNILHNRENINKVLPLEKSVLLVGSARFGTVSASELATNAVFIDGQEMLVGSAILGLKVEVAEKGTAVLCKCTNFKSDQTPSITTLQTFVVDKGINYLFLDTPFILAEGEAFGWSSLSTAKYCRGGYDSDVNKGYYYHDGSIWRRSGADLVMAVLSNDISGSMKKIEDIKGDISYLIDSKYTQVLGSCHFGKLSQAQGEVSNSPRFIKGQEMLVGTTIVGVLIEIKQAGTIVLTKCSGYLSDNPTFTDLGTYNVVVGKNYLKLSTPVTLAKNEAVGLNVGTAKYARIANGTAGNLSFTYYSNSQWGESSADIVMALLTNSLDNIAENALKANSGLNFTPLIGSARFETAYTSESASTPVFMIGQEFLAGKMITGMKVNIAQKGTVVICKCTNYLSSDAPSYETIQTFNVRSVGIHYLYFDLPVTLKDYEAIGWSNLSTAKYYKGGYETGLVNFNKGYYYHTGVKWQRSPTDLSMAILTNDMSVVLRDINTIKTQAGIGQYGVWGKSPYMAHLFIDKIGQNSDVIIPSQSVFDIDVAFRLGFKIFELNVNITKDGKGICMHGSSGTLGYEVTDLNGDFAPSVKFEDYTLAELQANYIYRSSIAKYRVPMTDLDTALEELKKRGMIPYLSGTQEQSVIDKVRSVFGDNFCAYNGQRNKIGYAVPIGGYSDLSTKQAIINACQTYGAPYIHAFSSNAILTIYKQVASEYSGIDMSSYNYLQLKAYFESLTETQQIELINDIKAWFEDVFMEIHKRNCYVAWAPCYSVEGTNQLFIALGADLGGSDKQVPDFDCGNICNYGALFGFSDFVTNGSDSGGTLTLTSGQTVTVSAEICELAKGSLHVRFNGTLNVSIGHKGASDLVSDGKDSMVFTSYFLNAAPTFTLTAVTNTTISELSWKASKC